MSVIITPHRFSGVVRVPEGSARNPVSDLMPADFSFAVFAAAAAVVSGGSVDLFGLDPEFSTETTGSDSTLADTQNNKAFFGFLEKMGCKVQWEQVPLQQDRSEHVPSEHVSPEHGSPERVPLGEDIIEELHPFGLHALGVQLPGLHFAEWQLTVSRNGSLPGGKFDLDDTPGLLPVLAVIACFAKGDTTLVNAAGSRIGEADCTAIVAEELGRMGVETSKLPAGLIIHGRGKLPQSPLKLNGHNDHCLVMALACAALRCLQPVEIVGAESTLLAYPGFFEMLNLKCQK